MAMQRPRSAFQETQLILMRLSSYRAHSVSLTPTKAIANMDMRINPVSAGLLGSVRRTMQGMFPARDAKLHQLLAEETAKSRAGPSRAELSWITALQILRKNRLYRRVKAVVKREQLSMRPLLFKCN